MGASHDIVPVFNTTHRHPCEPFQSLQHVLIKRVDHFHLLMANIWSASTVDQLFSICVINWQITTIQTNRWFRCIWQRGWVLRWIGILWVGLRMMTVSVSLRVCHVTTGSSFPHVCQAACGEMMDHKYSTHGLQRILPNQFETPEKMLLCPPFPKNSPFWPP